MKKTIYILMLASVFAVGCKKTPAESVGVGQLTVDLSCGGEYVAKSKADASNVNLSVLEYKVDIVRPSDGWSRSYPRFADMPQRVDLGSGVYTVTATAPKNLPAAFDQPVYSGSSEVTIVAGEVTPVSIQCTLSNVKVTFVTTERFREELADYTVTVTNDSWKAENSLVWNKAAVDDGTAGYFSVAPLLVKVDAYRSIDNTYANKEIAISSVSARDHHIITLDAQVTGKLGGITLIIDDTVVEKNEDVFIPGFEEKPVDGPDTPDDPGNPDDPQPESGPKMTWEANPTFADTPIASEGMNVEILIEAEDKIASFVVSVESSILSDVIAQLAGDTGYSYSPGHPYDMDLINNDALIEALGGMGLGLPLKDDLLDQTSVMFSLSGLIPLINMYAPAPGSRHVFTLKVTDGEGRSLEQPITFYVPED